MDLEGEVLNDTYPTTFSPPELQLYELSEYRAQCREWEIRQDKTDSIPAYRVGYDRKTYRLLRFFRSVQGFLTVGVTHNI